MVEAAALMAIPSLWASIYSWLTPTILFLLVNFFVGVIAIISISSTSSSTASTAGPTNAKPIARSPSLVLDRLKSFNLYSYLPTQPGLNTKSEPEPEPKIDEPEDTEEHHGISRSQSDRKPSKGAVPEKLSKKMKKSATMKSAFSHFEFEDGEEDEINRRRRPETMRERSELVREEDFEVDARADDFINRFKQQLKLQRLDSIFRYKEKLKRGGAGI